MEELTLVFTAVPTLQAWLEGATAGVGLFGPARQRGKAGVWTQPLEISVVSDPAQIDCLATDWRALRARCNGTVSLFQSYEWCRHCIDGLAASARFAPDRDLAIVEVRRHGRLVAVLPLMRRRLAGVTVLTWLGDSLTSYGDALISPELDADSLLPALIEAVRKTGADALWLRSVRSDAAIYPLLQRYARLIGQDAAPFVRTTPRGLPAGVSRTTHKSWRRRWRRLEEAGTLRFTMAPVGPQTRMAVAALLAMKQEWASCKGIVSRTIGSGAFEHLITGLCTAPKCGIDGRISLLTLDDEPIAAELGFVEGAHYLSYIAAYDPRYGAGAPGALQFTETLRACHEDGIAVFDLLPPGDQYKQSWADDAVSVSAFILPITPAGRMCAWLMMLQPVEHMKAIYRRLPASAKRLLHRLLRGRIGW